MEQITHGVGKMMLSKLNIYKVLGLVEGNQFVYEELLKTMASKLQEVKVIQTQLCRDALEESV